VANEQRKIIYQQRNEFMDAGDISAAIVNLREDVLRAILEDYAPAGVMEEQWDLDGLEQAIDRVFGLKLPVQEWLAADHRLGFEGLRSRILDEALGNYAAKEARIGAEVMRHFEKAIMLQVLDSQWKDHLASMDHLREGIHLRGYAQKNPKQEYKREAFALFNAMLERVRMEVIESLSKLHVSSEADLAALGEDGQEGQTLLFSHPDIAAADPLADPADPADPVKAIPVVGGPKIGRNQLCPCGSGKKYKHCCGRLD
jgi:preprotein translocase subunit SecA